MEQSRLVLHQTTKLLLDGFVKKPRQALLLVAEKGFGKTAIAEELVRNIGISPGNVLRVEPKEKASIGVDEVREIKNFLKLKTNSSSEKRAVTICDAELMTEEAQNSILKVLEEPPKNCFFILTTSRKSSLLLTILSRVEVVELTRPERSELRDALTSLGVSSLEVEKILALSNSLPGLAISIAQKSRSEYIELIELAKKFLGEQVSERLVMIEKISKDRSYALNFLEAIMVIAKAGVYANINQSKKLESWAIRIEKIMQVRQYAENNVSTKLALTDLAINL